MKPQMENPKGTEPKDLERISALQKEGYGQKVADKIAELEKIISSAEVEKQKLENKGNMKNKAKKIADNNETLDKSKKELAELLAKKTVLVKTDGKVPKTEKANDFNPEYAPITKGSSVHTAKDFEDLKAGKKDLKILSEKKRGRVKVFSKEKGQAEEDNLDELIRTTDFYSSENVSDVMLGKFEEYYTKKRDEALNEKDKKQAEEELVLITREKIIRQKNENKKEKISSFVDSLPENEKLKAERAVKAKIYLNVPSDKLEGIYKFYEDKKKFAVSKEDVADAEENLIVIKQEQEKRIEARKSQEEELEKMEQELKQKELELSALILTKEGVDQVVNELKKEVGIENKEEAESMDKIQKAIESGASEEEIQKMQQEHYEKFHKKTIDEEIEEAKERLNIHITNKGKEGSQILDKHLDDFKEQQDTKEEDYLPKIPLSPQEIFKLENVLAEAQAEAQEKLEKSPFKNKIIKKLTEWETFGVEQRDKDGKIIQEGSFKKRMIKTFVNLSLICGFSALGADAVFKNSVSAFATSALAKRMAFGLAIGTATNLNLPPKVKKYLPMAITAVMVGTTVVTTGGVLAALSVGSVAAGYVSSKFFKGQFTEQKIVEKQNKATDKLKEKYKDVELTEEKVAALKLEYSKIIKKYENMRIWGKPLDEGTKILSGSIIAGTMIGISGHLQDQAHQKADVQKAESQHDTTQKNTADLNHKTETPRSESQNEINQKNIDALNKELQAKYDVEHQTQSPAMDSKTAELTTIHKGEGIESALIRQIEHDPKLAESLGFKGDINDPKALHLFAGREAHILAVKEGLMERVVYEGDTARIENGHVVIGEHTEHPDYLTNKTETPSQNNNQTTNIDNESTNNATVSENQNINYFEKNLDQSVFPKAENSSEFTENKTEINTPDQNRINQIETALKAEFDPRTHEASTLGHPVLPTELLEKANGIFEHNIHHFFHGKHADLWDGIKDNTQESSAPKLLQIKPEFALEGYKEYVEHFHKLHEVTGLEPRTASPVFPDESPREYEIRATIRAAEMGPKYLRMIKE